MFGFPPGRDPGTTKPFPDPSLKGAGSEPDPGEGRTQMENGKRHLWT